MGAGLCVPAEDAAAHPVQQSHLQKLPYPQSQPAQNGSKALPLRPELIPSTPGVKGSAANGNGAAKSPAAQAAKTPGTPGDGPQRSESPERLLREHGKNAANAGTADYVEPRPPMCWQKGELIGVGAFGRVYVGLDEETGLLLAVKEVRLGCGAQTLLSDV